ncbi:MAG: SH3 domain-containing protein [Pseudomonadota bacterium]
MRLSTKAIAACALLSFSPLGSAAVYLGATGTMSEFSKYDDVKRGFGSQIFAGYRGETVPLMFEVAYLTTGDNDVDGLDVALSFKGQAASVGYYGKMDDKGSGFFAKVGYYTGDSRLEFTGGGNSGYYEETSSGATYAFGVDWMVARNFGFRFDVGGLINVKDLPGLDSGHKSNVTLINLGVVFAFGGSQPTPRYQPAPVYTPAVPAPAPAAVYAPAPAPVQAPAPQVYAPEAVSYVPEPVVTMIAAPAPTPAPSTSSVAKGSAQLVPGAVLRSGPTMKSAAIKTLPDGGSVKLLNRESNAEGPWWSVQLEDGTTGWMIEWGLTRISKP